MKPIYDLIETLKLADYLNQAGLSDEEKKVVALDLKSALLPEALCMSTTKTRLLVLKKLDELIHVEANNDQSNGVAASRRPETQPALQAPRTQGLLTTGPEDFSSDTFYVAARSVGNTPTADDAGTPSKDAGGKAKESRSWPVQHGKNKRRS